MDHKIRLEERKSIRVNFTNQKTQRHGPTFQYLMQILLNMLGHDTIAKLR